MRFVQ
jgi:hypothetical protein